MGRYRAVTGEDTGAITALHTAGHAVKDITGNTGVAEAVFNGGFSGALSVAGRPGKTPPRPLNIISRQVVCPGVTAGQLKESNREVLSGVSV